MSRGNWGQSGMAKLGPEVRKFSQEREKCMSRASNRKSRTLDILGSRILILPSSNHQNLHPTNHSSPALSSVVLITSVSRQLQTFLKGDSNCPPDKHPKLREVLFLCPLTTVCPSLRFHCLRCNHQCTYTCPC